VVGGRSTICFRRGSNPAPRNRPGRTNGALQRLDSHPSPRASWLPPGTLIFSTFNIAEGNVECNGMCVWMSRGARAKRLARPPLDLIPLAFLFALSISVRSLGTQDNKKKKNQKSPPFANSDERWGTRKVHCKDKYHSKTTANRRSIDYRSGIIAAMML
jgi:hypothetical protein